VWFWNDLLRLPFFIWSVGIQGREYDVPNLLIERGITGVVSTEGRYTKRSLKRNVPETKRIKHDQFQPRK
jgi:hypothetical protein